MDEEQAESQTEPIETSDDTTLWPAIESPAAQQSDFDLPPLDRQRPPRSPLIPKWIIGVAGAVVAMLIATVGLLWWMAASAQVVVPQVTGVSLGVAQTRLAQAGLESRVTDRRFSAAPRDEVLEQTPGAGGTLQRGDIVELVVSAGTEEFAMPDVIGNGIALARGQLEARGLVVSIESVPSEEPSDTVLATTPAPGAVVRTGDAVRVTVAAPVGQDQGLRPFDMEGVSVLIDPALTDVDPDVTMEVARRLRSLLQASGAQVIITRSAADTATADADRAQAARNTTATVSVGLTADAQGPAGRVISTPATGTPELLQRSEQLASAVASQLAGVAPPVTTGRSTGETVLTAAPQPWVRVRLGSAAVREEANMFADPRWADRVARAIYAAIGETYGRPLQ